MSRVVMLIKIPVEWDESVFRRREKPVLSYSLASIASYLRKKNMETKIVDCNSMLIGRKDFESILIDNKPDAVYFTSNTWARFNIIAAVRKAKELLPATAIVVGGRHFSRIAQDTLVNIPEVEAVIRGEEETSLCEIIAAKRSGGNVQNIPGISCRYGNELIHNYDRPLHNNLDDFAVTEDVEPQEAALFEKTKWGDYAFPVMAGRGCENRCTFCFQSTGKYRVKSVEAIIGEIMRKYDRLGIKNITFYDSALTMDSAFLLALCRALKKTGVGFRWHCFARANTGFELLREMKKAGCESVEFGLESGSPKVLGAIRKGISLPMVERFAKWCYELGLKSLLFSMVSLPRELPEDAQMTLDFIGRIQKYVSRFACATTVIFPGTALEKEARQKKILPEDFSWFESGFDNGNHDLMPSQMPLYFEHLTPEYVRNIWIPAFTRLYIKNKVSIPELAANKLKATLFDWEKEGLSQKYKRLKSALKVIRYKIS